MIAGSIQTRLIVAALIGFAVLAIWLGIMAYGRAQFREGKAQADAEWRAASERLRQEAAASATRADDRAVARLDAHREQVQEEQERVNKAIGNGSSPLDALFGA